jgi:hypothetical protein
MGLRQFYQQERACSVLDLSLLPLLLVGGNIPYAPASDALSTLRLTAGRLKGTALRAETIRFQTEPWKGLIGE